MIVSYSYYVDGGSVLPDEVYETDPIQGASARLSFIPAALN
jgi:hypothetical protein